MCLYANNQITSLITGRLALGKLPVLHLLTGRFWGGVTVGEEVFTDLDYADDVSLLAEMLDCLLYTSPSPRD